MPRATSDAFTAEFNRRLGNRIGRPSVRATGPVPDQRPMSQRLAQTLAGVQSGRVRLTGQARKNYDAQFNRSEFNDSPEAAVGNQVAAIVAQIDASMRKQQQDKMAVERAAALGTEEQLKNLFDQPDNIFEKAFQPVGAVLEGGVKGALDLISRPAYGMAEGMQNALEQGYARDPNADTEGLGENVRELPGEFGHAFLDFLSGAGRGLTGKNKTGFGEVYEEFKEGSATPVGEELRKLEERDPRLEQAIARTSGFAGEIFADPLNVVGGGSVGVLRETGERATREAITHTAQEAAERAIRDAFQGQKLRPMNMPGGKFAPGADVLATVGRDKVQEAVERAILEVRGGAKRGYTNLGRENFGPAVAQQVTEQVRTSLLKNFEDHVAQFNDAIVKGTPWTPTQIQRIARSDPKFQRFLDQIQINLNKPPTQSLQDFVSNWAKRVNAGDTKWARAVKVAQQSIRDELDAVTKQIGDEVFYHTRNLTYNAPSIRIGKDLNIPLKFIGKAYDKVRKGADNHISTLDDFKKSMSYEQQFPGRLSIQTARVKSIGVKNHQNFRKQVIEQARKISHADDVRIQQANEAGVDLTGKIGERGEDLGVIQRWVQDQQDQMWADEVASGARSPNEVKADNYAFIYNKKGSKDSRKRFKDNRKTTIKTTRDSVGYKTADAKAEGLKPVEGALQNLMYRHMKSQRDIARTAFKEDILTHYGFIGNRISGKGQLERDLVEMKNYKIPQTLQNMLKGDQKWYLPRQHQKLLDRLDTIMGWSNTELSAFWRAFAKWTGYFKTSVTVPFPGFHVRNMIGDVFMGLLDGVPLRTYHELLSKAERANVWHKPTSFTIAPGISMSWDELVDSYQKHALAGGYYNAELGSRFGVRSVLNRLPPKVAGTAEVLGPRNMSELREDFGRLGHFLHALREEASSRAGKRAAGNPQKVLDEAVEAAVYRVNHYKYDYSALTATEKKLKIALPFYTFTRKSLPTLLESLFLAPKNMSRVNRFMEYNDGSAAEDFNSLYVPQYMQEMGYATLTDEEEPFVMTQDILPTNMLNLLSAKDAPDAAGNVLQQVNPFINFLYETRSGEKIFSGQPTGPLTSQIWDLFAPGQSVEQFESGSKPWQEDILSNRLGAGIPARRVTQEQQDFRMRQLQDQLIDIPFREFNQSAQTLHVYVSNRQDGYSYRVANADGDVLFETMEPVRALEWAKSHDGS